MKGALFRRYAGYEKRAPKWMTDFGLEWLGRLRAQPRRLLRDALSAFPGFVGASLSGTGWV